LELLGVRRIGKQRIDPDCVRRRKVAVVRRKSRAREGGWLLGRKRIDNQSEAKNGS
jgi:hypothetical protein